MYCYVEIDIMQNISIDAIPLYNYLHMNGHDLSYYIYNPEFLKIVNSNRLETKLYKYDYLITACYEKGKFRSKLLQEGHSVFKKLCGINLPIDCYEHICSFLNNESLAYLVQAGLYAKTKISK